MAASVFVLFTVFVTMLTHLESALNLKILLISRVLRLFYEFRTFLCYKNLSIKDGSRKINRGEI